MYVAFNTIQRNKSIETIEHFNIVEGETLPLIEQIAIAGEILYKVKEQLNGDYAITNECKQELQTIINQIDNIVTR